MLSRVYGVGLIVLCLLVSRICLVQFVGSGLLDWVCWIRIAVSGLLGLCYWVEFPGSGLLGRA